MWTICNFVHINGKRKNTSKRVITDFTKTDGPTVPTANFVQGQTKVISLSDRVTGKKKAPTNKKTVQ